jgi:hypothetical protein
MSFPARRTIALAALTGVLAAGCTSGSSSSPGGQSASRSAGATEAVSLRGVCPATVVVQTNWWPQAEYGGVFQLLGSNPRLDTDRKVVSAPLVAHGVDTGVRLEIRSGGPANSFTPSAKVLYLDRSVTLGGVDVDQAALSSRTAQPVQAVFAPLERSPLILMWDPASHPDFHTIADIGRAGTRVLYFQGSAYMDYLVGAGILHRSQVEGSYDGTPARFVAERGRIVQQGFLTNEVFQYENELPQWHKKVAWALVDGAGYPNYPETLAIRPDRKAELSACLHRLVPILQRGTADYAAHPAATNDLIVRLVRDFGAYPYSAARASYAVGALTGNGLLSNGGNAAVGDFDEARVDRIIAALRPVSAGAGAPLRAGLTARDLVTNEYIDPSIGLGS